MIRDIETPAMCWSEYDPLKRVVLCPPRHLRIDQVINEVQARFQEEGINTNLAEAQHRNLVETLRRYGIDVILLEPDPAFADQVFTRDIGFTLGSRLFVSNMEEDIRKGEERIFTDWLIRSHIPFHLIRSGSIEGGDVMIDRETIWVGDSGRTSRQAVEELSKELPGMEIIPLAFPAKFLHLDCVFNVLSPREALIYPQAFQPEDLKQLSARYELIEVERKEQFTLGTNILSLGNRTLLSLPINSRVNETMRRQGFHVVEVDLSEIIKSGGAFRCSTLPLVREVTDER
ncbi:dimethylarginine dimethylaminohydrolase family protein [Salinithrix halophila]|uniref:Dimethylarginine dimethylaminohydrolase family protein n=1 Tax=Salinithrix halophila TaxID=1485204 RepID=A0ABV8JI99_9BACL